VRGGSGGIGHFDHVAAGGSTGDDSGEEDADQSQAEELSEGEMDALYLQETTPAESADDVRVADAQKGEKQQGTGCGAQAAEEVGVSAAQGYIQEENSQGDAGQAQCEAR